MKTIHKPPASKQDQRRMAVLKGAPEIVLKSCTHYFHKGTSPPLAACMCVCT